jgi:hypothetical protein
MIENSAMIRTALLLFTKRLVAVFSLLYPAGAHHVDTRHECF